MVVKELKCLVDDASVLLMSDLFERMSMKDKCLYVLMDSGYMKINEWIPFDCVVAKGIYELWSIKRDAIRKL